MEKDKKQQGKDKAWAVAEQAVEEEAEWVAEALDLAESAYAPTVEPEHPISRAFHVLNRSVQIVQPLW